jgi:putative toxin-antitoxin system antitoxin component (TIGR02293 family)
MTQAARAAALLGGAKILKRRVRKDEDLGTVVREGLPAQALRELANRTHTSVSFLIDTAGLSRRTLERRLAAKGRLKKEESDRVVRLAWIVAHATDTLGDENGLCWLQERHRALGGKRPADLLDTEADARRVDDVLSRIDHGVFN